MKKLILIAITIFSSTLIFCQAKIDLNEVTSHIGDSVKIEGKIFGVKTFSADDGKERPVLMNLGADYPNQLLTIAVFPSYKTATVMMPSEAYKGDLAIVTGRIELYKGKPQIVVRETSQLQISSGEQVVPKQ